MARQRHNGLDATTLLERATGWYNAADVAAHRDNAMRMAKAGSKAGRKLERRDRRSHAPLLAVKKFSWES